jgi:hypothetical protein
MAHPETTWVGTQWIHLAQNRDDDDENNNNKNNLFDLISF